MATFLGVKTNRLERASSEGIVSRDEAGLYPCELATAQWLNYERGLHAKGGKRTEFERQRARLTRAKAEAAERKLAMLDRALVGTCDIINRTKAVCLRIKSKLQAGLPRIARNCYYAPNLTEALFKVRAEFDLLIAELSALGPGEGVQPEFEVVASDEDGAAAESSRKIPERSPAAEDPSGSVS
jgi:phage terminase Nu1 subunit (DNA packaging protein)